MLPTAICRVTVIWRQSAMPTGDLDGSRLAKTIVTEAFVIPACPLQSQPSPVAVERSTEEHIPFVDQIH